MIFCKETDLIQTPIGLVPNDWEVAKISDIAEINKESRDPSRESPDVAFQYVDIESVTGGSGRIKENKKTLGKEAPSRARRVIHENDVLMSTVRPYLKAFTIVPKWYDNEICSTGFAVLTSKENVDPRFLLHTLFSDNVISQCNRMMVGGQYPALNSSQVGEIKLPLPPIPEQRAIVRVLGVVDSTIELTDCLIAKTERLKKGLMQQLLTHGIGNAQYIETPIGKIPDVWQIVRIGDCVDLLTGFPFESNLFSNNESDIKVVRGINVTKGRLRWDKTKYWKSAKNLEKYLVQTNDVLIGMDGALVGKNYALVRERDLPILLVQRVARLRAKDGLHPEFLYFLIGSPSFRNYVDKVNTSSGIAHISSKQIEDFQIPFPPYSEQLKIVDILSAITMKLTLEVEEKKTLERVKYALMDLLLTGKIRIRVD